MRFAFIFLLLGSATASATDDLAARVAALETLVVELQAERVYEPQLSESGLNGTPNIVALPARNSIDPQAFSSAITGGGENNHIGIPGDDYAAGMARRAVIAGGYDNLNNQLAGTISGGAHHLLAGGGDHGTVGGGSYNAILSGSYSTIAGGSRNTISGTNSVIGGGIYNVVENHYAMVAGGFRNNVYGYSGVVFGGRYNQVDASAMYASVLSGRDSRVSGRYGAVFGSGVVGSVPGALSFAARNNGSPGDAQAVQFHLSTITGNSEPRSLSAFGEENLPQVPDNTVWAGEAHIAARRDDGTVSVWRLPLAVGRTAGAGWVAAGGPGDAELVVDNIGLGATAVTALVDAAGDFRLNVQGEAGAAVHWGAYIAVTQVR